MSITDINEELAKLEKSIKQVSSHVKYNDSFKDMMIPNAGPECKEYHQLFAQNFGIDSILVKLLLEHPNCFSEMEKRGILGRNGIPPYGDNIKWSDPACRQIYQQIFRLPVEDLYYEEKKTKLILDNPECFSKSLLDKLIDKED